MNWPRELRNNIKIREPLKRHTTFRIGGEAAFFCEPKNTEELKLLIKTAMAKSVMIRIIGCGSNILPKDKLKKCLVVKLSAPNFRAIEFDGNKAYVGSGALISSIIRLSGARGLSGLEFLAGVPATVGGTLVMNAGAWGQNLSNLVEQVEVMDYNGRIKNLSRKTIKFFYRGSNLGKFIVISCCLNLKKKSTIEVKQLINYYISGRRQSQDLSLPSAGCVFKNPQGNSAGKLIDLCGLKGKKVGGAAVSEKHANFIVNQKNAKAADVMKLIRIIKNSVNKKFGVDLCPEIMIWD